MNRTAVLASTAAVVVAAGAVGGGVLWKGHQDDQKATQAAQAAASGFASAWSTGHLEKVAYAGTTGKAADANFETTTQALGKGPVHTSVSDLVRHGDTATAKVEVHWSMPGDRTFSWTDPISLVDQKGTWKIKVPSRSLWHPKLAADDAFVMQPVQGKRGQITGRGGAVLMKNQTVYDIVIDPVKATPESVSKLQQIVGIGDLVDKLKQAQQSGSKATIPVITYRKADYDARKAAMVGLDGVLAQKRTQPLAKNREFGQPILGRIGPVTAEQVKADPDYYHAGMYVGQSGLQAQYEKTLAAKDGFTITTRSHPDKVLFRAKAKNGTTVKTTLDPTIQTAAQKAVDKLDGKASALVAIDVKTGNVLAVANGPSYGSERAITGKFAPGSTLKMATAYTWLTKGHKPTEHVNCPIQVSAGGQQVRNFMSEHLDNPPFTKDFAISCNTAFVNVAKTFDNDDLHNGAKDLGIGADWADQLGYKGAFTGSIPIAKNANEKTVSAFGQAKTQASPLSLAVAAGSIARGAYIPPTMVTNPKQPGSRAPQPLKQPAARELKKLMRLPVSESDGTATKMQGTPGGPVYAKTGTAEFIDNGKPASHAWLAGWQGNIAFCALVVSVPEGQGGGTVAAPVVKDFLTTLAHER